MPSDPVPDVSEADAPPATADELLLELMDLLALAFPSAPTAAVVSMQENEDGKRPALTNLDVKSAQDAATRPDLGHDDNRVLDALNALLADIADATERAAGVRVHTGTLTMRSGADGDRFVELTDTTGAAPELVMTRRFDRSELRWLLFTEQLFAALNRTEEQELVQRATLQQVLKPYRRFQIDMNAGRITFEGPAGGTQVAPRIWRFVLLGSHKEETQRFMWGWANDAVGRKLVDAVDGLRTRSTGDGLRAFTEPDFGGPEKMAARLCAHAAVELGAAGVYRAPFASTQGKGFMYLALFDDVTA